MNIILWIIQIILAIKLLSVAYSHGLRQDQTKIQAGIRRMGGASRPVLYAVAIASLLLGAGLILPLAGNAPSPIVPLSAGILAGGMILSIPFHRACRENPNIIPSLILFGMAAFAAYGRLILVPFE
ncbi:MAG: DoxX family protein [Anaerolineales bacterium]